MVLNSPIPDAHPNRRAQQEQTWKNHDADPINHNHDTLWRQQILPLRPIHHLPWFYPLPMFLFHGQPVPTMELPQVIELQKRLDNWHHYPTPQPHPILLAYKRR